MFLTRWPTSASLWPQFSKRFLPEMVTIFTLLFFLKLSTIMVIPIISTLNLFNPNAFGIQNFKWWELNRYRRGLETCPQAKTSKSGRAIFSSFFRHVRATSMTQRRVENTRVHFWTLSPVSVNHSKFDSNRFC